MVYFISYTWRNGQNSLSFGNGPIEEFPLKWLKKMQDERKDSEVRLLWWIQLTKKEDIEDANRIDLTAL